MAPWRCCRQNLLNLSGEVEKCLNVNFKAFKNFSLLRFKVESAFKIAYRPFRMTDEYWENV